MIKILIVDDSPTETAILINLFSSQPDFSVIGHAKNGKEAIEMVDRLKPDIITMDIEMPIMNGLEATRHIMAKNPTPIVVISSKLNNTELDSTFQALEAGALSVLEKPENIISTEFIPIKKNIIATVRSMAEIKVVKRRFALSKKIKEEKPRKIVSHQHDAYEILAIGTSVGGPQALKTILSGIPASFPAPIVVVQHMTPGFMGGFVNWLNDHLQLAVKSAEHGGVLQKGTIYFAPDYYHLQVERFQGKLVSHLIKSEPVSGFCPSATVLLESVAKSCGKNAVGVLLTGMGSDGAQGLLELKNASGHTLIQDEESTVVFGMAGVAQSLGAVDKVIKLNNFTDYLIDLFE